MSLKVLITGGSGLIGTRLTKLLLDKGYDVAHLGRSVKKGSVPAFVWTPDEGEMDDNALANRDAVIHLAGASIAGRRWTDQYKKQIMDSRINSTRLLYERLKSFPNEVRIFVSASAIGYYGIEGTDKSLNESDKPG